MRRHKGTILKNLELMGTPLPHHLLLTVALEYPLTSEFSWEDPWVEEDVVE